MTDDIKVIASEIRKRSGSVNSKDPLVTFLYILMRDYLTPGTVETIMIDQVKPMGEEIQFSNGWLATYAKDIVERLS